MTPERGGESPAQISKWSNHFIWTAIIQGLAATLLTIPLILSWIKPSIAQVIASGSAGTWFPRERGISFRLFLFPLSVNKS